MLRKIDETLLREITNKIVQHFQPEQVLVFGSHARGQAGPDSDLDLIVVMKSDKPFWERAIAVDSIFGLRNWPMDLLVYTPEEFAAQRAVVGTLPSMIQGEARVIYERP
jgi:predicted nucleotidyltransferase